MFSLSLFFSQCVLCLCRRVGGRTEVMTVGDNLHIPSLRLCHIADVQVSGGVKRSVLGLFSNAYYNLTIFNHDVFIITANGQKSWLTLFNFSILCLLME